MASANLDLVRSIMANLEPGDWSDYLGSAEWAHPEIQWVIAEGPTAGSWTGVAAIVQSVRGILEAWQELRFYAARSFIVVVIMSGPLRSWRKQTIALTSA